MSSFSSNKSERILEEEVMLSGYTDTYLTICGESWLPATDSECKAIEGGASPECCMGDTGVWWSGQWKQDQFWQAWNWWPSQGGEKTSVLNTFLEHGTGRVKEQMKMSINLVIFPEARQQKEWWGCVRLLQGDKTINYLCPDGDDGVWPSGKELFWAAGLTILNVENGQASNPLCISYFL